MPLKKKGSETLERAEKRSAAVRSISHTLNMGGGLSLENYNNKIDGLRSLIAEYNETLSNVDRLKNEIVAAEKDLRHLSELMLMGVATTYGKDSNEYEMAGGIRKSDRKRPTRRKKAEQADELMV